MLFFSSGIFRLRRVRSIKISLIEFYIYFFLNFFNKFRKNKILVRSKKFVLCGIEIRTVDEKKSFNLSNNKEVLLFCQLLITYKTTSLACQINNILMIYICQASTQPPRLYSDGYIKN